MTISYNTSSIKQQHVMSHFSAQYSLLTKLTTTEYEGLQYHNMS